MRIVLEVPKSLALYEDAAEGLARINERMYRQARTEGRRLPSVLDRQAAVRYIQEYPGEEDWKHVGRILAEHEGDCEDLAAARAGELRSRGVAARVIVRRISPTLTHAYVALPGDQYEDPSRRLGMGPADRPWRWKGSAIPMANQDDDDVGGIFSRVAKTITKPKNILAAAVAPVAVANYAAAKLAKGALTRRPTRPTPPARPGMRAQLRSPAQQRAPVQMQVSRPAALPPGPAAPAPADAWPADDAWSQAEPARVWDDAEEWPDEPAAGWAGEDDGEELEELQGEPEPRPRHARHHYDDDNWDAVGADTERNPEVTWSVDRTATGWQGRVRIPLDMGRMMEVVRTVPRHEGASKAPAKALDAASKILDNPAVAALLPPQAKLALQIAKSKTAQNVAKKLSKIF